MRVSTGLSTPLLIHLGARLLSGIAMFCGFASILFFFSDYLHLPTTQIGFLMGLGTIPLASLATFMGAWADRRIV